MMGSHLTSLRHSVLIQKAGTFIQVVNCDSHTQSQPADTMLSVTCARSMLRVKSSSVLHHHPIIYVQ